MANYNPKLNNLYPAYSAWKNRRTKAIRIPEVFESEIMRYARALDAGEKVLVAEVIPEGQFAGRTIRQVLLDVIDALNAVQKPEKKYLKASDKKKLKILIDALESIVQQD